MGGAFRPSTCGGDPLVWAGCGHRTPRPKCTMGCRLASPGLGGLAATQRECRPANGGRGACRGLACPCWGRQVATGAPGRPLGLCGFPIQPLGGWVGEVYGGCGLEFARWICTRVDLVRLVAAFQPQWIVGVSAVHLVSTEAMGNQVEPPPNLVGRSAVVASLESWGAGVRRRPVVGVGNGMVVVPKLWLVSPGGHHRVHR